MGAGVSTPRIYMEIEGEFTCDICGESFERNVEIAGHMRAHQTSIDRDKILTELKRLADEKGRSPMQPEVDEETDFTAGAVQSNFGSWRDGLAAAGLEPRSQTVSREDVIEEIQRVANLQGHSPTVSEMREHGVISQKPICRHFGTWKQALKTVGLETTTNSKVSKGEVLRAIGELATQLGRPPTAHEMDDLGACSTKVAQQRFGTWNRALRHAGCEIHCLKDIPEADLQAEIDRLVDELGHAPSSIEMDEYGRFSTGTYAIRYKSWADAVEAAGYEHRGHPSGPENPAWKGGYGDISYGPNWYQQRKRALERDDFQCQMPGCTIDREQHRELFGRDLNVHHIVPLGNFIDADGVLDYEQANQLENLATVCHRHRAYWEQLAPLRPDIR